MNRKPAMIIAAMLCCMWTLCTPSCTKRNSNDEAEGQKCLAQARMLLNTHKYSEARTAIDTLRQKYPLALNAREEGILLLDSIEIADASETLTRMNSMPENAKTHSADSIELSKGEARLKLEFYTKKLAHDKKNFKTH